MSSAVRELSSDELLALLEECRNWNEREGITGALFYRDGCFLQAIEGEEATVRRLFAMICRDPRHRGITPLFQEQISQREFPDWTMAFYDLDEATGDARRGFHALLNQPTTPEDVAAYPAKVRAFLRPFMR